MKQFTFLPVLLFLFVQITTAQTAPLNPCGTADVPEHIARWIQDKQQSPSNYRSQMPATVYVPIQFHLVGTNNGTGFYAASDVFRLLCDLNEQYIPVGMHFYNYADFNYISNSQYYEHDFDAGEEMMNNYNVNGAINVYIVSDPAGNCGYFSWGGDAVAIAKSCAEPNETTLAHELGHFFFLPHTFRGWEGRWTDGVLTNPMPNSQRERVNGSNCATTGDFFCDTPADYLSYRWQCPYTGILPDPNGTPIDPDETLYMSYAYDACTKRFSPQQIETMLSSLYEERSELLDHPQPTDEQVGNTYVFYPASGSTQVNPDHVLLKWSQTQGATNYYLEVMQYTDIVNGTNFKGFVNTTEITLELDPGVPYFWTVQPLNPGNTCGGKATGTFETAATNTTLYLKNITMNMPSCFEALSGTVSIEAAGGQQPYSYLWSNGSTSAQQSNLEAGLYSITVTDGAGTSNVMMLNVPQPAIINAQIVQTDNFSAAVSVSGGTIPYSIEWSNGETGNNAYTLNVGANTVTITDGNGCILTRNVNTLAIQALPASISCNGLQDGSVNLQIFGGVEPYTYSWSNGLNTATISNLSQGNYAVTVTDAAGTVLHLNYTITEPTLFQSSASVNGNTVSVQTSGGTPPFVYYFPSGASVTPSADITGFPNGTYEIWIYDFNGCQSISPFSLVNVGIDTPSANSEIAVYPSLVYKGQQLLIELRGNFYRNMKTDAVIYNTEGKVCNTFSTNLAEGDILRIGTDVLPAGTYFVRLQSADKVSVARFTVIE